MGLGGAMGLCGGSMPFGRTLFVVLILWAFAFVFTMKGTLLVVVLLRPVLLGPVLLGPVFLGPVFLGPVFLGPVFLGSFVVLVSS